MRAVSRCLVVLAAVATTLTVTALPAAAILLPPSDVTAGTLTLTKTGQPTISIPLASPPGCPADDIDLDYTSPSTAQILGYTATAPFTHPGGGTYIAVHTRLASTAGSIGAGPSAPLSGLGLQLRTRLYTPAGACAPGALLCTFVMSLTMGGTYSGVPSAPTPSDYVTLASAGATVALGGACAAPFSTHTGGTATATLLAGSTVPADVTNGWVDYNAGSSLWPLTSTGICPPDGLWMNFVSPSSATVVGFTATASFVYLGTGYVTVTSLTASTAGTVSGSTLTGLQATLQTKTYTSPSWCAASGSPVCTYTNSFTMNGTYTGTGNPFSPVSGDVIALQDLTPGPLSPPATCSAPFTSFTTATLNSLTATVV